MPVAKSTKNKIRELYNYYYTSITNLTETDIWCMREYYNQQIVLKTIIIPMGCSLFINFLNYIMSLGVSYNTLSFAKYPKIQRAVFAYLFANLIMQMLFPIVILIYYSNSISQKILGPLFRVYTEHLLKTRFKKLSEKSIQELCNLLARHFGGHSYFNFVRPKEDITVIFLNNMQKYCNHVKSIVTVCELLISCGFTQEEVYQILDDNETIKLSADVAQTCKEALQTQRGIYFMKHLKSVGGFLPRDLVGEITEYLPNISSNPRRYWVGCL